MTDPLTLLRSHIAHSETVQLVPDDDHNHAFVLDMPDGPESIGRCACGEERSFYNSIPEKHLAFNGRQEDWTRRQEKLAAQKAQEDAKV